MLPRHHDAMTMAPQTAGPVAGAASAVPGTVGGLASASLNVAASTAASIGVYGARLGTRLWVGAATEVARIVVRENGHLHETHLHLHERGREGGRARA